MEEVKEQEESQEQPMVPLVHGVPYDLIQHFSIAPVDFVPKTRQKLADIYRMLDGDNFSDKFRSLVRVEKKIGSGGGGQVYRYEKVWNWLRLNQALKMTGSKQAKLRMEALEESQRSK